ncbi:MAG: tripartite tricarboxylate transporter substrate binding protein, partial [Burkholderiaceae bacterium]
MSPSMRAALRLSASTVLGVALFALQTAANAQTYPTRPIKLVVPIGQGTNSDIASRLIAEHLSKKIGQPVVVENKPGA